MLPGGNMKRRDFITLAGCAAATAWPLGARGQQNAVPVVGWLSLQPLETTRHLLAGFKKGLSETGFIDGKTISIEYRPADAKPELLPDLAADLVKRGVAVIFAATPPAIFAAKRATATTPIVFTSGADPVRIGLVASFNQPGGNVTGFHIQLGELAGKRLSLLCEMMPGLKRIAVLVNPANPSDAEPNVHAATEAARVLGVETKVFNVSSVTEFDAIFASMKQWGAKALLIGNDPLLNDKIAHLAALAARDGLPASGFNRPFSEAGGLMSYGPDFPDLYRRAGVYVGRILKGDKPSALPVQQPTKYELILNLKTARVLGLNVPISMLAFADEVFE
jgi:putative tryptophan/tyrosine transport system substrate-binding protein